jgi:uncharacterized CHY-type Zn-finger protein
MTVLGISVNAQTGCAHYHSDRDIVAIRFKCCDAFYACIRCHEQLADHPALTWGRNEREKMAVLCGACRQALSIREYLGCAEQCPRCGAAFNPGCAKHHHFYFDTREQNERA